MKDGYKLCLILLVVLITATLLVPGCASRKATTPEAGATGPASGPATLPKVSGDLKTAQVVFEQRCSACHGLERPLSVQKTEQDWRMTVERMQIKVFSHISDEDAEMIIAYLAATQHP